MNLIQVILAEGKEELTKEETFSIRIVAEASMVVALSVVLSFIKIYTLPQGGSITAGSMLPILWLSLRRGVRVGLFASSVYGLIQFMVEPFFVHPAQLLLDYPIAFGVLALAGLFKKYPQIGVGIGILGRFIAHFFSGIIFFSQYAPKGMNPAVYSVLYNGSYLIGELIVSSVLMFIIVKRKLIKIYL